MDLARSEACVKGSEITKIPLIKTKNHENEKSNHFAHIRPAVAERM